MNKGKTIKSIEETCNTFLLVMIWFKINQIIVKVKYLKLYMRKMLLFLCTQQSGCLPRGHYLQSLDWRQREKQTNPSGYPLNLQMSDQGRGILTSESCWDLHVIYRDWLITGSLSIPVWHQCNLLEYREFIKSIKHSTLCDKYIYIFHMIMKCD